MPTYSISGPDGKTYSIDGPEGATREQVIAKIQENIKSSPQSDLDTLTAREEKEPDSIDYLAGEGKAAGRAAENLFTMGLAQPAKALAGAAAGKGYDQSLSKIKSEDDALAKSAPGATFLGGAAGLLGSMGTGVGEAELAGEGVAAVAKPMVQKIIQQGVKNAPVTAGVGGVSAAANQPGDLGKKAMAGTIGAGVGTVAGFIPPAIGEAAGKASPIISDFVQNLFKGDQTTEANKIVRGAIESLGQGKTVQESSSDLRQVLNDTKAADEARTREIWKQSGINESTPAPVKPLRSDIQKYISGLTKIDQTHIPSEFLKTLRSLKANEPLSEIQGLRSYIFDQANAAFGAGKLNEGRVLSGLENVLEDHAENPALSGMSPEQTQKYIQARQATREMKQAARNKYIDKAIGTTRTGQEKTPESEVGNLFVNKNKGSPEALDSILSYLDRGSAETKNAGYAEIRDVFSQKLLDASASKSLDTDENPFVNLEKIGKFIDQHQHIVDSKIFDKNQRATLEALSNLSKKSAQPLGQNNKVIHYALQKLASKMAYRGAGEILGGIAGASIGHVPGAIAGAVGGGELASAIQKAPQQKMASLVMEAIKDPDIAAALQTTPNKITPRQQSKILAILGQNAKSPVAAAQTQQSITNLIAPRHPAEQTSSLSFLEQQ